MHWPRPVTIPAVIHAAVVHDLQGALGVLGADDDIARHWTHATRRIGGSYSGQTCACMHGKKLGLHMHKRMGKT